MKILKHSVAKIRNKDGKFESIPALVGENVYELAVRNGYIGTEDDYLRDIISDGWVTGLAKTNNDVVELREDLEAATANGATNTNQIADKAITRTKLANDALYSPLVILENVPEYTLTVADVGKTFRAAQTVNNITINSENSTAIPLGAEFAVCRYSNSKDVTITFDGVNVCSPGWDVYMQGGKIKVTDNYGMIALKKMTNKNMWLVTGNVEVVS